MSGVGMSRQPGPTSPDRYRETWQDYLRHVANLFFVLSFVNFEHGNVMVASACTLTGELLLAPSAIKHRSWSTVATGALFIGLALSALGRGFLGGWQRERHFTF